MFDPWISLSEQYNNLADLTGSDDINFKELYDNIAELLGGATYDDIELAADSNTIDIDGWKRWVIHETFGIDETDVELGDHTIGAYTCVDSDDLQLTLNDGDVDDYIPLSYDLYHDEKNAPIALIVYSDVCEVYRLKNKV